MKSKMTVEYMPSYGGSYYLTTSALLEGAGIKMADDGRNHKRGKKTYHVTEKAFEKIKKEYPVIRNTKSF